MLTSHIYRCDSVVEISFDFALLLSPHSCGIGLFSGEGTELMERKVFDKFDTVDSSAGCPRNFCFFVYVVQSTREKFKNSSLKNSEHF